MTPHPYADLIALMDAAAAKPDEIDLRDDYRCAEPDCPDRLTEAEARRRASAPRPLPPYRRSHGYRD